MALRENAAFVAAMAVGGAAGYLLTAKGKNIAYENGIDHMVDLANIIRSGNVQVHSIPRHEIKQEYLESADLVYKTLHGAKIIVAGDSQVLPSDKRVTTPDGKFTPIQPQAMDAFAAAKLNETFPGLDVISENHARPGLQSSGLLEQLQDKEGDLRKALLESSDPTIFAFSIGPNDWQQVVSDPNLLNSTTALGVDTGKRGSLRDALGVAGTLLGLAKGHKQTGEKLESTIPQILKELKHINEERVALRKQPLLGTSVLFPADFGKAYAISVGQPGVEANAFELNAILKMLSSKVSRDAGRWILNGVLTEDPAGTYILVSQEGIVFPMPTKDEGIDQKKTRRDKPDQHTGPEGQDIIGGNFAGALLDWVCTRQTVPLAA